MEPTSLNMFLKQEEIDLGIDTEIQLKVDNDPIGTYTNDESIDGTSSLKVAIKLEDTQNQEHSVNLKNKESLLEPIQVANNVSHTEEVKFPKIRVIQEAKCTSYEYQYHINFNDVYEDPQGRKMIASIYHFFEGKYQLRRACNKKDCDLSPLANTLKRTSEATGISKRIINSILLEESKPRRPEENKKAEETSSESKKGLQYGRKRKRKTYNFHKIKAKENSLEQTTVHNEECE